MAGIVANGVELRPTSGDKWFFWITRGFDDLGTVRGTDVVLDGVAGRFVPPIGRVADTLIIEMRGWIVGRGATEAIARADYRTSMDTLAAIFDPIIDPFLIEVHTPVMGIAAGKKRSLNARFVNAVWGEWVAGLKRSVSATYECVDSPPRWVEANE
jgi:hypothetical protein